MDSTFVRYVFLVSYQLIRNQAAVRPIMLSTYSTKHGKMVNMNVIFDRTHDYLWCISMIVFVHWSNWWKHLNVVSLNEHTTSMQWTLPRLNWHQQFKNMFHQWNYRSRGMIQDKTLVCNVRLYKKIKCLFVFSISWHVAICIEWYFSTSRLELESSLWFGSPLSCNVCQIISTWTNIDARKPRDTNGSNSNGTNGTKQVW